jgi:hypothetical protein
MRKQVDTKARRVRVERGIYRYANGSYAVCVMVDGAPRFKVVGKKLAEARRHRELLSAAVQRGDVSAATSVTFAELSQEFLAGLAAQVAAGERSERTLERYADDLERHILPRIGNRRLASIKPDHLASLIAELRASGLAPWTIKGALTPLGRVFNSPSGAVT